MFTRADWIAAWPKQRKMAHFRPDSGTCCGLLTSLSAMDRVPLNEPAPGGVKVTLMLHELPDATLAGHGVLTENGPVVV